MSIAKRLTFLLAVPLLALVGLGIFTRAQLATIKERARFVAETQIGSLSVLGDLSRDFEELRVRIRAYAVASGPGQQASALKAFQAMQGELDGLLSNYAEHWISDEKDRRLMSDFETGYREWLKGAQQVLGLMAGGRREEAGALVGGTMAELGEGLRKTSGEWIQYNKQLADEAGRHAMGTIDESEWKMLVANFGALVVTGLLGFFTFRRIVRPIQGLETSVKTIAAGDYSKAVPFTSATDETGGLARSIDVLKKGASAMEEQRWVKSNAANLTAELQAAGTLAEFGEKLISGLVPLMGGGVAGLYVHEEGANRLRRIAAYGLSSSAALAESFGLGENLVGQCAQERKALT